MVTAQILSMRSVRVNERTWYAPLCAALVQIAKCCQNLSECTWSADHEMHCIKIHIEWSYFYVYYGDGPSVEWYKSGADSVKWNIKEAVGEGGGGKGVLTGTHTFTAVMAPNDKIKKNSQTCMPPLVSIARSIIAVLTLANGLYIFQNYKSEAWSERGVCLMYLHVHGINLLPWQYILW